MFVCDKCGECCRHLDLSPIYAELNRGDGICRYLVGNLCSIYAERPLICKVDECYQMFFQDTMTKAEFYQLNYQSCQKIKRMMKER